jgi:glycerophosphoryl diester phosphodiesterase
VSRFDWLTTRPIAHRGLHGHGFAENSLGAARAALAKGYGVECDVRLSRDGKVFVFHDDRLDRLTGESGAFANRDAVELCGIGLRGADEAIPLLTDFLALAQGAGPLVIELKSDFSGDLALARAVAALLGDTGAPVALKSFDPALIAALRAARVPWPLGIVAQEHYDEEEFAGLSFAQRQSLGRFTHAGETQPDFLSWRATDLPHPLCEFARACAATPVMTWTIRTPEQATTARKHADQIVFEGFAA